MCVIRSDGMESYDVFAGLGPLIVGEEEHRGNGDRRFMIHRAETYMES
jgi:hypothetical protein